MNSALGIRLVCLDLGGVVVRICRSWEEACANVGVSVRACPRDDEQLLQTWRSLSVDLQLGRIDNQTFADRFSLALNGLYSPQEIDAINRAWILGEYAGIGELVDRLHRAGLQTAALSNTSREHWVELVRMPAISRLKHRLGSFQMGLVKPDPAIYREFERRVGFSGNEIAFFDDTEENVLAARELGWIARAINPAGSPPEQILTTFRSWGAANIS
ncbi:MAG: HAD-IA family hydrolase [Phycisphaerales bacterium]|nr:MAG: HAD-IA family hydrolase [Phycisphaerales bacterium]